MTRRKGTGRDMGELHQTLTGATATLPKPSVNGTHRANGHAGGGTAATRPKGLATTRLNGIRPRPVRWLVDGLVPLGKLTLLAGDGGHGKTTLTLHLTAAVSTGVAALGRAYDPAAPADVLLISCEDDFEDTIVPRLLAMGADLSRVSRVDGVPTPDGKPAPFSLAHYQQLEEELEANPGVRLVVIDPAGAYIGRTGVDDHKDSELRALLGPLAELAAKRNVAVILVKHLNKGTGAKAVNKVGGSVGYVNAVRAAFVVAPHPDDEGRKLLLPLKFNLAPKPAGVTFRLEPLPEAEREAIAGRFAELDEADRRRLADQLFRPVWGDAADIDADEALGEDARKARQFGDRIAKAAEWLKGFLGESAWPDAEVEAAAGAEGFTKAHLMRAKAHLRKSDPPLSSKPKGFGAEWWNWIGGLDARPADRPTPYGQPAKSADETVETVETADTGRTGTAGRAKTPGNLQSQQSQQSQQRPARGEVCPGCAAGVVPSPSQAAGCGWPGCGHKGDSGG